MYFKMSSAPKSGSSGLGFSVLVTDCPGLGGNCGFPVVPPGLGGSLGFVEDALAAPFFFVCFKRSSKSSVML